MAAEFTTDAFDTDVLGAKTPVLVDFWATWCGPCRQIAPVIDELAVKYQGRVSIGKVNVEEQPELAQRYGINAIPTLLLFKDGEKLGMMRQYNGRDYWTAVVTEHAQGRGARVSSAS